MFELVNKLDELVELAIEHGTKEDRLQILYDVHKATDYVLAVTSDLHGPRPDRPIHQPCGSLYGQPSQLSRHLQTEAKEIVFAMETLAEFVRHHRAVDHASDIQWQMGRMNANVVFKAGEEGEAQRKRLRMRGPGTANMRNLIFGGQPGSRAA